jgi:phage antirepressor YoqD-like protein
MNDNQIINISGVSCYEKDCTAYLSLEAVARGLGFTQTKNGVEYVRWETVDKYLSELGFPNKLGKGVPTSGHDSFIPENIFYRLAMKAKNEAAEKFQALVADEIIPSIRKHGAYMTPEAIEQALLNPDTLIKLATTLKEEREQRMALAAKIEEDAPATNLGYAVTAADDSILIGVMAKILRQNGYDTGEQRFFETLRREGFLIKSGSDRNMPTQRALEMGLFTIKENVHVTPNGSFTTRTTLVTGKGQNYFVNRYCGKGK